MMGMRQGCAICAILQFYTMSQLLEPDEQNCISWNRLQYMQFCSPGANNWFVSGWETTRKSMQVANREQL